MRHILTLALALMVATVAQAATVTGTIQDANGDATTTRVEFWPLTAPLQSGDALIVSGRPVRSTATNGVLSVSLAQGLYQVRIGSYDKIKISVPSGSGSYEIGTLTADGITYIPPTSGDTIYVSLNPTNYTALSTNLETHLAGIDVALAEAGGSVDLTGTNDLAGTGQLLNADYISSGYLTISTNITDHNTAQYSGMLIVTTNMPVTTDWIGNYPVGLTVAGTDGILALVGTEEGGHTAEMELVQIDDADGSFVDKWVVGRLGNAEGAALEFLYSATDPYEPYTKSTNIVARVYPAGYFQVRGEAPIISLYDDVFGTTDYRHWGIVSDEGQFYLRSYDTHYYSNPFSALTVNQSGDLTLAGDISNTGTLSVSNNIAANNAAAFGGALISTTNRTLSAATVLSPAPAQIVAQGTEGYVALVGGPEGNFSTLLDFTETAEGGTTLTDKWTLAKRTYSSNSALAYYYGPNADLGSNTNVYYLSKEGDTWNKRNATIGGNLTVATNGNYGGALTVGYDSDGSNYEYAKLSHDGAGLTTLGGFTAGTGTDAQSLKIKLAGNGALYVDGDTATNPRGNNAVDLQVSRSAATEVAAAPYSTISGGRHNEIYGSSLYAAIGGGYNNYINGTAPTIAGGYENTAGNYAQVTGGRNNTASGSGSLATGYYTTAFGTYSGSFGHLSSAYLYGQQSFASGQFSAAGDAQGSRLVMRNTTTGSSADLFCDGSSVRAVIPANKTWMFEITVSARSTDGGTGDEESAAYKYVGCIERDGAGNTALVGTVTETVVAEDDTDWSVVVSADDTNDALDINVTSDDANTVRWVAVVTLTEVGG